MARAVASDEYPMPKKNTPIKTPKRAQEKHVLAKRGWPVFRFERASFKSRASHEALRPLHAHGRVGLARQKVQRQSLRFLRLDKPPHRPYSSAPHDRVVMREPCLGQLRQPFVPAVADRNQHVAQEL